MTRLKLATVWLGGCSGCHMSFLDLDEWLFDLVQQAELVYSPFADVKTYPKGVDVALVEGAIANQDHLDMIRQVRDRTKYLISFGDCAVTGNVTAIRNVFGEPTPVLSRAYLETDTLPQLPKSDLVPPLTKQVLPVHRVVSVDCYLPGCPPDAHKIKAVLEACIKGEALSLTGAEMIRFE